LANCCPTFDATKIFKADYDGTTDKGNTAARPPCSPRIRKITKWLVNRRE
jgi:L-arabinose transport system substrate-binding protein